ncbi:MAG: Na/Pi cotransporter family protein [Bacteroidota bacterium]
MLAGLIDILKVLGALAFFVFGMKIMSEGIQKAGSVQLRKVLSLMTRNRFLGVLTGFLVTAFVQSSSATTVMTVSFVNAGLLSLFESAGIIMGANIGTTITGWIISVLGFQVKLHTLSIPIFAIGVPLTFVKKGKARFWGDFLIGFAILFLGLQFLQESIPTLQNDSEALAFLSSYANWGVLSGIIFILVGFVTTLIIQSSSVAMALILVMSANGWVTLEVAAAMVLGQNLGTTATAEIAALVGNVFAKRAARIHTLFNVLGVCWMMLILPWFLEFLDGILQQTIYTNSAYTDAGNVPLALSAFHTVFNVLNTLIFIGLTPWLVSLATRTISSRGEEDEINRLDYLSTLVSISELSILEIQKKVAHFGEVTGRMSGFVSNMLFSINPNEPEEMMVKVQKYEEITNRMNVELSEYLIKISKEDVTSKTAFKIKGLIDGCSELERIANIFYLMGKTIERKRREKIWFNQHQRSRLNDLIDLINHAFVITRENLTASTENPKSIHKAAEIEKRINDQRDLMRRESQEKSTEQDYNVHSELIYHNLFSSLERIGDHLFAISRGVIDTPV